MVPGGVICFFPSYDYEAFVYNHFEKHGFLQKLNTKKRVFREPKKTGQMDQVYYCTVPIQKPNRVRLSNGKN
jgi:chromosome transmission fidelity protein 1